MQVRNCGLGQDGVEGGQACCLRGEPAEAYQRLGLWLFHQFGVDPTHQRRGIGSQLLEVAEEYTRRKGASELACDTAVSAGHLISPYERKGFQMVGKAAFAHTYYESVIPAKKL